MRLALKQAGFDAGSVSSEQMRVVVERVLGDELRARGVDQADAFCAELARGLAELEAGGGAESPEAIFARLGGGDGSSS